MNHNLLALLLAISALSPLTAQAKDVAGIKIAESISFSDQSTKLTLNGAGIRTKFIFDIYVGSLYLEKRTNTSKGIYSLAGEKRISLHFLYNEVSKEKLVDGWNDGFEDNLSSDDLKKHKLQITQFNNLFITVKKGDVINLDFIPTTGTKVTINNKVMGLVEGDAFFIALLKIWLGDEPADDDLKKAMLGKRN